MTFFHYYDFIALISLTYIIEALLFGTIGGSFHQQSLGNKSGHCQSFAKAKARSYSRATAY